MENCEVTENCLNVTRDSCWYCDNYAEYHAKDPKIICKRQIEAREQRKEEKKERKATPEHKRGKEAVKTGDAGEKEIVRILNKYHIKAERVKGSGRLHSTVTSCDVKLTILGCEKKAEVKRRKKGFETIYNFLAQDSLSNMVFMKSDRKPWLVCMTIDDFISIFGGLYNEPMEDE